MGGKLNGKSSDAFYSPWGENVRERGGFISWGYSLPSLPPGYEQMANNIMESRNE